MGTNMQRQAVPVVKTEMPLVMTGMEKKVAHDSGTIVLAETDGIVERVDANRIVIKNNQGATNEYYLKKFIVLIREPVLIRDHIVEEGQRVTVDTPIADGPNTDQGFLSLGRNVLVA